MSQSEKGVVKWFNDAKGYGFIEHTNGEDVFVHYSVIESEGFKTLKDGESVEYEMKSTDKGLNATRVVRLIENTEEKQLTSSHNIEIIRDEPASVDPYATPQSEDFEEHLSATEQ